MILVRPIRERRIEKDRHPRGTTRKLCRSAGRRNPASLHCQRRGQMPEQANETESDGETQRDGSQDHQGLHPGRDHERTRSERSDHCQFDDFAMI